jgi:hypothetical protein
MMSEWESMTIDDLFALREQMREILSTKLLARKAAIEFRLQQLNRRPRVMKTVRPDLQKLVVTFGYYGCAWTLLPLVSNL